MRCDLCIQFAN